VKLVEKATDVRFAALLPYANELHRIRETGTSSLDGITPSAVRYARSVHRLFETITKEEPV
jgi:hypothetical protein